MPPWPSRSTELTTLLGRDLDALLNFVCGNACGNRGLRGVAEASVVLPPSFPVCLLLYMTFLLRLEGTELWASRTASYCSPCSPCCPKILAACAPQQALRLWAVILHDDEVIAFYGHMMPLCSLSLSLSHMWKSGICFDSD